MEGTCGDRTCWYSIGWMMEVDCCRWVEFGGSIYFLRVGFCCLTAIHLPSSSTTTTTTTTFDSRFAEADLLD